MKVFISSEAKLPKELESYKFRIAPERLHHALYYASIVVSEGSTIASEAGVLGTPAIYINSNPMSYCQEQERYGMIYNTPESKKVLSFVDTILNLPREHFRIRREKMLAEKTDVTAYLFDYIHQHYGKEEAARQIVKPAAAVSK